MTLQLQHRTFHNPGHRYGEWWSSGDWLYVCYEPGKGVYAKVGPLVIDWHVRVKWVRRG